jgi:lysophospholipase L1-like esterase
VSAFLPASAKVIMLCKANIDPASLVQDNLGYDITFVGPFTGTHGPTVPLAARPQPPLLPGESAPVINEATGLYAAGVPGFFGPSGHASWWGRQVAQSKETIKGWVETYQPDYLLILLGFNDLGWFVSGPEDLIGNMGQLVENAREGKSDVKILLGNVVHRKFIEGRQDLVDNTNKYNQLLRDTYQSWFRWESPIAYVDVNSNYNCHPEGCPDGYDGLHPNSMGEYHIAQAFARSLKADFGFQGPDFVVPPNPEPRVISTPTGVVTGSYPEGLYTIWNRVPTARGYDIRSRLQGQTNWWSEGSVYPNTWASWSTWLIDGQTWEFQVRTRGDNDAVSDWSDLTTATAHLQTSPGPPNIVAVPSGGDGIQISWGAVTGYSVNRYGVIVWDMDTEGAFIETHAATGTSFSVGGLKPGHRYGTWVATYVNLKSSITGEPFAAGGLPAAGPEVIVGAGAPAPPTTLRVTNTDPTTVQLSWTASANAAGYAVYVRSVRDNTNFNLDGKTTATTYGVGFLVPGTWNFEFCVSAYNGNLESAHTACVIPPVYPGYSKRDEVPVFGNSTVVVNNSPVYNSTYNSTTMIEDKRLPMLFKLLGQSIDNSSMPQS